MSLRRDFVLKALEKEKSIVELCRDYGISRKTGYKWIARFRDRGFDGLVDESRRPDSSPVQTSADMALDILKLRKQHPTWGPKKIRALLARRLAGDELPSSRTVARVLERGLMTQKRRRYRRPSKGLPVRAPQCRVQAPNDLWTVDFKGWWLTTDGRRCEPLTVRDAHSRMVLAIRILDRTRTFEVRQVFETLFTEYGLPLAIQSDNGPPFASLRALGGITQLSAWWLSLGIDVIRSRPGCPQDNGGHERMHGDIRVEVQQHAASSLRAQQDICDKWRLEFNHVRPHEALGMRTPAEVYRPSSRRLGHVIIGGFPEGCETRALNNQGVLNYLGKRVYVSSALRCYHVALQPFPKEIRVWFFNRLLGAVARDEFDKPGETSVLPIEEDVATPDLGGTVTGNSEAGDTALVSPGDAVTCNPGGGDCGGDTVSPVVTPPTEIKQRVATGG